jgi:glucose-6-phosphate isomerase
MNIHFDEKNLLAGVVGSEHGLTREEIDAALPAAQKALQGFHKLAVQTKTYGFPHLPFQQDVIASVNAFAAGVRGSYDTVCVVGIGGSALGAWALDCGLRGPHPVQGAFSPSRPRLVILDNVDPEFTALALASMNPASTLAVVIAKSGGTAETVATFLIVQAWMEQALGQAAWSRIVAVTTEGKGDLFALAGRERYKTFDIPGNVGGRFSVLSAVGLVPAALIGVDIEALCRGAAEMTHLSWQSDLTRNVALRSALLHWLVWTRKNKPIQVAFPYSNRLWGTAFWFRQLWAESLGKARTRGGEVIHTGQTPVAALGATDQHSQVQLYIEGPNDKVFTFWALKEFRDAGAIPAKQYGLPAFDSLAGKTLAQLIDAEQRATAAAMAKNNRPNCAFILDRLDEEHLGAFLQLMEFQTAFLGELLNINAFDQEGVELGKKLTFGLMDRPGFEQYRDDFDAYEKQRAAL